MYGARGEQYGIWNTQRKCWQFGICEDTPMLAEARLVQKIGDDARKWRFEARVLPAEMRRTEPEPQLLAELQRKDRELKLLRKQNQNLVAVRHSHWVEYESDTTDGTWVCSGCGQLSYAFMFGRQIAKYCPHCGAKMDEEV